MLLPPNASAGYQWRNVPVYGGGFVPGVVYNQGQPGGLYLRTNVGGAWRWNASTGQWIPLTDFFGQNKWSFPYILSLATDPVNPERLYAAVGGYVASWAGNGAILVSTNRGDTWAEVDLSIKIGGNDNGHYAGERLQVDPNLPSTLFLGSTQDGLWKSTDFGATWNRVTGLTPTNLNFVCIDPASGQPGRASQRLIVGVMSTNANIQSSTNGGNTWSPIASQPAVFYPMHFALASNLFYVAYASANGQNPNGATNGSIYRYNLNSGQWTDISPPKGNFGFSGICVDKQNPGNLLAGTIDRWAQGDEVYRSTNGGSTWTGILRNSNIDGSQAAYTQSNYEQDWINDIQINPFNSNEAIFVTGYGVFMTEDLNDADKGKQVAWSFRNKGLEETVVIDLASPPTGPWLLSALADVNGFRYDNLDVSPTNGSYNPYFPISSSIDFAELAPNIVVRSHTRDYVGDSGPRGSYSLDGGITWTRFPSEPGGAVDSGVVAISADGKRIVWTPSGEGPYYSVNVGAGTYYSTNFGATWTPSAGLGTDLRPVADRVNPNKFYAYDAVNGVVYTSIDGAATFSIGATGLAKLPSYDLGSASLKAVFGKEGNLWLTAGNGTFPENGGFYRSTNSGASFTQIGAVTESHNVGFGKAAPGQDYPAIYVVGTIGGGYGFYRSDDQGMSWARINDDRHQFGTVYSLTGDPKFYGRVYVGTGGRGALYADEVSPVPPLIQKPKLSGTNVVLSFQSESGFDYVLERAADVTPLTVWQNLSTNTGTGGLLDITTAVTSSAVQQFFRLRTQSPQ
jgi:hypothetical protein